MKQHSFIRALSLLLSLVLVCSLLPGFTLTARAETYSGTCGAEGDGSNLTWTYDTETNTLTIAGTGEMASWARVGLVPWYIWRTSLQSVSVSDGVTCIGDRAFMQFTALSHVSLPDSIASIGSYSFYGCPALEEVPLPQNLTGIGEYAFYMCYGLCLSPFPDSVSSIGQHAFGYCEGTTQISVPASVTSIGYHAFGNNKNLKTITVAPENPNYSSDASGLLFNQDQTELILCPGGFQGVYTVPGSVRRLSGNSFECCNGLTEVIISSGLTDIGACAFDYCENLAKVTIPGTVTSIGNFAFYNCCSLTDVTIPNGVTTIGNYAFEYCTALPAITIPKSVMEIGYEAFAFCTKMTKITVAAGNPNYSNDSFGILFTKNKDGIYQCPGGFRGSYTVPEGVWAIAGFAFAGCTGLTGISFPDSLTTIDPMVFLGCSGLTSVRIPASVTSIGDRALGYDIYSAPYEDFIIYGFAGTAAETYAQENSFPFRTLDPASGFWDVKTTAYYYQPMLWALEHGIASGTSSVAFSPNQKCTRGQVVTFLWKAMGKPEPNPKNNPFVDVKSGKYYYKPVLWAYQTGVTKGADDTHFNPGGKCNRAQVVTFLWNALGKPTPKTTKSPFVDVKPGKYYYNAVLWAVENGITKGIDATHFGPNQTCTRGQVVTFLYNALK